MNLNLANLPCLRNCNFTEATKDQSSNSCGPDYVCYPPFSGVEGQCLICSGLNDSCIPFDITNDTTEFKSSTNSSCCGKMVCSNETFDVNITSDVEEKGWILMCTNKGFSLFDTSFH